MSKEIILASRSPRRAELMRYCGLQFRCEPSDIDEIMDESLPIDQRMEKLAYSKAAPIFAKHPDQIVIGADTIVYIDDQVIGKAGSKEEARAILKKLSGRQHQVMTGVCVLTDSMKTAFTQTTEVVFDDYDDQDIEDYLALNEWEGKAGAYAIQGYGCRFVKEIHGDYCNVIGLPVGPLCRFLKTLKND